MGYWKIGHIIKVQGGSGRGDDLNFKHKLSSKYTMPVLGYMELHVYQYTIPMYILSHIHKTILT